MGASVGGTGVSAGGIGESVGGTGVAVGGTSVAVDAGSAVAQPTQNITIHIDEIMSFVCFISSSLTFKKTNSLSGFPVSLMATQRSSPGYDIVMVKGKRPDWIPDSLPLKTQIFCLIIICSIEIK